MAMHMLCAASRKKQGLNVAAFDIDYGKRKGRPTSMDINSSAGFLSASYFHVCNLFVLHGVGGVISSRDVCLQGGNF